MVCMGKGHGDLDRHGLEENKDQGENETWVFFFVCRSRSGRYVKVCNQCMMLTRLLNPKPTVETWVHSCGISNSTLCLVMLLTILLPRP